MRYIIAFPLKVFLILLLLSCVNTSYSRLDEKAINDELVDLILGQFPHHGKAFYEHELKIKEPKLKANPNDFELRNDIAVAYLKLERWYDAKELFSQNDKLFPNRYKTHANLGVMYKKMGEFSKAAFHIKKSLEIKPEGHMGLGHYYLKMIKWRKNFQKGQQTNFLGVDYENRKETKRKANKKYVITLIINDFKFIDSYIVLGDILFEEKKYQLAMRAYMRAEGLAYEYDDEYHFLASMARRRFQETARLLIRNKSSFQVGSWVKGLKQIRDEIDGANNWLNEFQKTEAAMIANNEKVSFDNIRKKMETKGIHKPQIIEAAIFRGFSYNIIVVGFALIVSLLICYHIYDKFKRTKLDRPHQSIAKKKHQSFRLSL